MPADHLQAGSAPPSPGAGWRPGGLRDISRVLSLAKCHLASSVLSTCTLFKTASRLDLQSCADAMSVVKGQGLAAPKDHLVISFRDPGLSGSGKKGL